MECRSKNWKKIEFLSGYLEAARDIETYRLMLALNEDKETRPGAVSYTDMPKAKNRQRDLSDYMAEQDELRQELLDAVSAAERKKTQIARVILRQKIAKERKVLVYRYLRGLSWTEIAKAMGYASDSSPRELHGSALEHMEWPIKNPPC